MSKEINRGNEAYYKNHLESSRGLGCWIYFKKIKKSSPFLHLAKGGGERDREWSSRKLLELARVETGDGMVEVWFGAHCV